MSGSFLSVKQKQLALPGVQLGINCIAVDQLEESNFVWYAINVMTHQ